METLPRSFARELQEGGLASRGWLPRPCPLLCESVEPSYRDASHTNPIRLSVMDDQSQITKNGQYFRRCNSCRRRLNLCYFGRLWNGREGFNSTCRTCRKQQQKRYFIKSYVRRGGCRLEFPSFISSLDPHNGSVLTKVLAREGSSELGGVSMKSGDQYRIKIQGNSEGCLSLTLLSHQDHAILIALETSTLGRREFIQCCLSSLREFSIRLLEPEGPSSAEFIFLQEITPSP